jgi:hypothetical protein
MREMGSRKVKKLTKSAANVAKFEFFRNGCVRSLVYVDRSSVKRRLQILVGPSSHEWWKPLTEAFIPLSLLAISTTVGNSPIAPTTLVSKSSPAIPCALNLRIISKEMYAPTE